MSIKNKEINDEQLENVTGGSIGTDGIDGAAGFAGFINMYELHKPEYFGKSYYFVQRVTERGGRTTDVFFCAKLVNSYEAWNWFSSVCTHDIRITASGNSGWTVGRKVEICGNEYAVYKTRFGEEAK